MACRRGSKVKAHHRWGSVSSVDIGTLTDGASTPSAQQPHQKKWRRKDERAAAEGGTAAAAAARAAAGAIPLLVDVSEVDHSYCGAGNRRESTDDCTDHQRAPHQGSIVEQEQDANAGIVGIEEDEGYPEIPTDDLGIFMTTLVEGMRSDGVQLANSAKSVVTNTFHVVVRPLEAVARMAAPFFPQPPAVPTMENAQRGHAQLDNALAFRMPGSFIGRPRNPPHATLAAGGAGGTPDVGNGALRSINGNSPPQRAGGSSSLSKPGSAGVVGALASNSRDANATNRGRPAHRLGAVKLPESPPEKEEQRRQFASCSPSSPGGRDGRNVAAGGESFPRSPGVLRRVSLTLSPPRRALASALANAANVLPFAATSAVNGKVERKQRCRRESLVGKSSQGVAAAAVATTAGAEQAPRRAVVEGSRIDLRGLDRAKGGNRPRAYRCRDGSVVVLGRERMLSVRPDVLPGAAEPAVAVDGQARVGVVTWVLKYGELESCCINVSAGKESERSVGDVVVEITTRPSKREGGCNEPGRRSFCLTNPSECLELLKSIQARWQPRVLSPSGGNDATSAPSNRCRLRPSSDESDGDGYTSTPTSLGTRSPSAERAGGGGDGGGSAGLGDGGDENGGGGNSEVFATPATNRLGGGLGPMTPSSDGGRDCDLVMFSTSPTKDGMRAGESLYRGIQRGVIVLESPAKVLRDQLRERHEQHEKGLKMDLESKARSSRANLQRRRQLRRSFSQGATARDRNFCPKPASKLPAAPVPRLEVEGGNAGVSMAAAAAAEPDMAKYKQMLKVGLSEGAVRHKMEKDGVAASSAAALFAALSTATPPPSPSPPPPLCKSLSMPMPPPLPRTGATVKAAGGVALPGLPRSTSGIIPAAPPLPPPVNHASPPPPPPPPLPSPRGLFLPGGLGSPATPISPLGSMGSVGGAFFGGSATMPDTPTRRRTSKALLNLHWDVLPAAKIEKTVWAKATGRVESVDDAEVEEIEKLFARKMAAGVAAGRRSTMGGEGSSAGGDDQLGGVSGFGGVGGGRGKTGRGGGVGAGGGAAAGGRVKKVQLLDVSRGNNVAIGLKSFKRVGGLSELASLVAGLDPEEILTTEDLQRLEACLPTEAESKKVMSYEGPVEALGTAEAFFRALAPTPRPQSKVSAMIFSRQFWSVAEDARARLATLRMACEEATTSDKLARVLERVLIIGNLLNEGTYQGNACGFRLASLLKLSHTKSRADKKTTVLHYMVRSVAVKEQAAKAAASAAIVKAAAVGAAETDAGKMAKDETAAAAVDKADKAGLQTPPAKSRVASSADKKAKPSPDSSRSAPTSAREAKTPPRGSSSGVVSSRVSGPWLRGVPPGCRGSPDVDGQPSGGRGSLGARRGAAASGRAGGRARGVAPKRPALTRVETLDLEAELKHVRAASKMPIGEILLDVRQAKRGLRQAKEELDFSLAEETQREKERERGTEEASSQKFAKLALPAAPSRSGRDQDGGGLARISEGSFSENSSRGSLGPVVEIGSTGEDGGGREQSGADGAGGKAGRGGGSSEGVRKLAGFVEKAGNCFSSIDDETNDCVVLCRGLGEFFGEAADEAQSTHIFRTLVQFLDLLAEGKKAEGLC